MDQMADSVNFFSTDRDDYAELTFAPGTYGSGIPDNKISYVSASNTTHNDFAVFAVKVIMYGLSTVDVPKIANLRVIALPKA